MAAALCTAIRAPAFDREEILVGRKCVTGSTLYLYEQAFPVSREYPVSCSRGVLLDCLVSGLQWYNFRLNFPSIADGAVALPFLQHTEFLLSPLVVCGVLWIGSLFGFNLPKHIAPIFVIGSGTS